MHIVCVCVDAQALVHQNCHLTTSQSLVLTGSCKISHSITYSQVVSSEHLTERHAQETSVTRRGSWHTNVHRLALYVSVDLVDLAGLQRAAVEQGPVMILEVCMHLMSPSSGCCGIHCKCCYGIKS